jgi:hypothetical protein
MTRRKLIEKRTARKRPVRPRKEAVPRLYDFFISYSHEDTDLIRPLGTLLRLPGTNVFWDDRLRPGEPWQKALIDALYQTKTVVVFWCCHSALSTAVADELRRAWHLSLPIVPVLMCNTFVPAPLREIQWIDLSAVVSHRCKRHRRQAPPMGSVDLSAFILLTGRAAPRLGIELESVFKDLSVVEKERAPLKATTEARHRILDAVVRLAVYNAQLRFATRQC